VTNLTLPPPDALESHHPHPSAMHLATGLQVPLTESLWLQSSRRRIRRSLGRLALGKNILETAGLRTDEYKGLTEREAAAEVLSAAISVQAGIGIGLDDRHGHGRGGGGGGLGIIAGSVESDWVSSSSRCDACRGSETAVQLMVASPWMRNTLRGAYVSLAGDAKDLSGTSTAGIGTRRSMGVGAGCVGAGWGLTVPLQVSRAMLSDRLLLGVDGIGLTGGANRQGSSGGLSGAGAGAGAGVGAGAGDSLVARAAGLDFDGGVRRAVVAALDGGWDSSDLRSSMSM